jgi:hypothetical protein
LASLCKAPSPHWRHSELFWWCYSHPWQQCSKVQTDDLWTLPHDRITSWTHGSRVLTSHTGHKARCIS